MVRIKINLLCKHLQKGQKQPSVCFKKSCTELSKTQIFYVGIVNISQEVVIKVYFFQLVLQTVIYS